MDLPAAEARGPMDPAERPVPHRPLLGVPSLPGGVPEGSEILLRMQKQCAFYDDQLAGNWQQEGKSGGGEPMDPVEGECRGDCGKW